MKPNLGRTLFIAFTEAKKIEAINYRINVTTTTEIPSLLGLGSNYDHFSQKLIEAWGNALAKALLMDEPVTVFEAPALFNQVGPGPQSLQNCRLRLCQTSLVILPANALPLKIPLSYIQSSNLDGYKLRLTILTGTYEFSKIGNQTQFFAEKLASTQRALEASSIETIRSMLPSATYEELRRLSMLMLEGRAVMRKDVEAISPDLWARLEHTVAESPLAETYAYLSKLGDNKNVAIGLRKSADNVYVWFLFLTKGSPQTGGNTLIMEITSESGHATYLFRVLKRQDFTNSTAERFLQEGERLVRELNEAMIATGFRREPVYLTEDQLNTPNYARYLFASKNLEPLKLLRERFFARIIHRTYEQWQHDLGDALVFNTNTSDEQARWANGELEPVEAQPGSWAGSGEAEVATSQVSETPTLVGKLPVTSENSQRLNLQIETAASVTAPILAPNVTERVLTLSRIDGSEDGKVTLWLKDKEMDHDTAIMLNEDDAGKLGAFPGSRIKVSLQKV